jgi:hypothetical protein
MKENKINEDIVWQRIDVVNEAYDRFLNQPLLEIARYNHRSRRI